MARGRQYWLEAEEKWPALQQFIACYLHQTWPDISGTPDAAIDEAVAGASHELRKIIAQEWWRWNATAGAKDDPRRSIQDGLGACVRFENPLDARQFMNSVYDKLIVAVRAQEKGWKPSP
ncbi:MAG: contact-dependent growth inhibition system immunity protein [Pseudomonadota bacterium]